MNCYKIIDLSIEDLIVDKTLIPKPAKYNSYSVIGVNPKLYLTENFYQKLSQLGSLTSLVFHMYPYVDKKSIHIDISQKDHTPSPVSFNIIIEGQGIMKWFNPIDEGKLKHTASSNIAYIDWNSNFGEIIDQWTTGKIALVRTDIPHNVCNPFDQERLAVSIRWNQKYSWKETLEWFDKNL